MVSWNLLTLRKPLNPRCLSCMSFRSRAMLVRYLPILENTATSQAIISVEYCWCSGCASWRDVQWARALPSKGLLRERKYYNIQKGISVARFRSILYSFCLQANTEYPFLTHEANVPEQWTHGASVIQQLLNHLDGISWLAAKALVASFRNLLRQSQSLKWERLPKKRTCGSRQSVGKVLCRIYLWDLHCKDLPRVWHNRLAVTSHIVISLKGESHLMES